MRFSLPLYVIALFFSCQTKESVQSQNWQLAGFEKTDPVNPVLLPDTSSLFFDPIRKDMVKWEAKDVFNPASVVRNDTLFLLYRAEDFEGQYNGTSRIGLAWSIDGQHFTRKKEPVFYPQNDAFQHLEWEGGAEDPRIVEDGQGRYIMTYTAYDGNLARLLIATSDDLLNWTKYGSVFEKENDINQWSKSGSILCQVQGSKLVATRVNGSYWMYFGDTDIFLAYSDDLISWNPVTDTNGSWQAVLSPRKGKFDSNLVEPGPPALLTKNGVLLIYNSRNHEEYGDKNLADGTYAAGQALFSLENPAQLTERSDTYFFKPDRPYELTGQVNNVCFVEGLSFYKSRWFLYYGTADSKIAVAVSSANLPL